MPSLSYYYWHQTYIVFWQSIIANTMKKFVGLFIFFIILMQAFSEVTLSAGNAEAVLTKVDGQKAENEDAGLFYRRYHPRKINCNYSCARRCSKSSRKNVCSRACKTCCFRCHCVPPGTSGNHQACPCYARLKTHGNRPKCP
ncbi:hypothetical protein RND81_03G231300 [Saponaria officinalis]|uniref:Uncharacterized protein n=1 Tax=Saponaria officinalis TaxID=3572 RepID=A0AAW1MAU7_SAPOF